MKWINIECSDGVWRMCPIYSVQDFPYQYFKQRRICESKNKEKAAVYNVPCAFDIESTTIRSEEPWAFMYIWQFCIEDKVVTGRTWEEFFLFLDRLRAVMKFSSGCHLVVYVHYLSYEWQFIKDFFQWDDIFARDARKVMKCTTITGIEFRCSWFLSNMSLEKYGEYCGNVLYCKQVGKGDDYDYKKLRTPDTKLTDFELSYCYCDVRGLCQCISYAMLEDTLATIPLTSTGYVRRDARKAMSKNRKNRTLFQKTRITPEVYKLLKDLGRGGNTASYYGTAGKILHDVECWDISSSYPFVIMAKEFPMGAFTPYGKVSSLEEYEMLSDKYCVICRVCLIDVHVKIDTPIAYIPLAKTSVHVNIDVFNGRILHADEIEMAITEIDWKIIHQQYTIGKMAFRDVYIAPRGKLPKEIRAVTLHYFDLKTSLKGVDPYMYMKSKNRLNAIFGMMYTDPVREQWEYDSRTGEWKKDPIDIEAALDKYYDSWSSFLPYQWGAYVTAWARYQLNLPMQISKTHTVYCDTDSNKVQGMPKGWMDGLNAQLMKEAEEAGAYAFDKHGNKVYMGIFENEGYYDRFCTLGAKKYCFEKDGKFKITIAGVNKVKGAFEMDNIDNFRTGFTFYYAGGTTVHYRDWQEVRTVKVNGCTFTCASNCGIVDSTYQLGITEEFFKHLNITDESVIDELSI